MLANLLLNFEMYKSFHGMEAKECFYSDDALVLRLLLSVVMYVDCLFSVNQKIVIWLLKIA